MVSKHHSAQAFGLGPPPFSSYAHSPADFTLSHGYKSHIYAGLSPAPHMQLPTQHLLSNVLWAFNPHMSKVRLLITTQPTVFLISVDGTSALAVAWAPNQQSIPDSLTLLFFSPTPANPIGIFRTYPAFSYFSSPLLLPS